MVSIMDLILLGLEEFYFVRGLGKEIFNEDFRVGNNMKDE